ncbi:Importin-13 B like [Heracleum sosnowskyi]|uniref:Importin-13 B like n=1 Tax=Heracleum sosnowskyi TaxID=360622 RepID=A0AAD8MHK6_9APIA|nr:Importin-13 B like [Heracleum sosnowskyi]
MATVSLKLLVDNSTEKVIFAEAGKDFVDFLFGLLEIPLGSLLSLLVKEGMCESLTLSKVYESVNKFGNECLQPDQTKKSLLNPDMPFSNTKVTPLMQQLGYRKSQSSSSSNYYGSSRSDDRKEVDGLGVKDIGTLKEKMVDIDMKALELVRTSFRSSTVLTDVFVEKTVTKCEIDDLNASNSRKDVISRM